MLETHKFFRDIFGKNKIFIEKFTSSNLPYKKDNEKTRLLLPVDEMAKLTFSPSNNYYFLPNIVQGTERLKEHVVTATCLFLDFDGKEYPEELKNIAHYIFSRGKGHYHAYIKIKHFKVETEDDIAYYESVLQFVIGKYGSDRAVKNINRLMRIPHTNVVKPDKNVKGVSYTLTYENPHNEVLSLQDFVKKYCTNSGLSHSDKSRLALQKIKDLKLKTDYQNNRNTFILSVCHILRDYGFSDTEIKKRVQKINDNLEEPLDVLELAGIVENSKTYRQNPENIKDFQVQKKNLLIQKEMEGLVYTPNDEYFRKDNAEKVNPNWLNKTLSPLTELKQGSLNHVHRYMLIETVDGVDYKPQHERITKDNKLNLWSEPDITIEKGDLTVFFDFINFLIPNKEEREHFLNYMAYSYQHQNTKIRHAILLVGGRGIGKSMVGQFLKNIFGKQNVVFPSNDAMGEKYTSWLIGKKIVFCNEIKRSSGSEVKARLDIIVGDDDLPIRSMFSDFYSLENIVSTIVCANDFDVISVEHDERRWAIIQCASKKHKEGVDFYNKVGDFIKEHSGRVAHYLANRNIEKFEPTKPPEIRNELYTIFQENTKSKCRGLYPRRYFRA